MKKFHSSELLSIPPKPIDYIVTNLIPCGGICEMSGPPGEGKSSLALSLAAAVSSGSSWFGLAVKQTKVAWITGESSDGHAIARDLHRLGVSDKSDILFLLPETEMFMFDGQYWITTPEGKAVLCEVREAGIEFVVIDTTGSVVAGSRELDNDQQRQLARHLRKETTGMTVLTISHTNQSSANDKLDKRLHYLSRAGGNGFPGAVRWASGVSQLQAQDAESVGIEVQEIMNRRLLAFGVSKNNEMPRPIWTNRAPAVFEIKDDGRIVLFKDGLEKKQAVKPEYKPHALKRGKSRGSYGNDW